MRDTEEEGNRRKTRAICPWQTVAGDRFCCIAVVSITHAIETLFRSNKRHGINNEFPRRGLSVLLLL